MTLPVFVSETLHHEAIDWATRASANGGLISTTTIRAVSEFCRAIDSAGIRDRFLRLNLSAGGFLGSLVPLYRAASLGATVIGNATDTNINFVSGDHAETGSSAGWKGNGTTKYLQTGLIPSSSLTYGDTHQSTFVEAAHTTGATAFPIMMGCRTGSLWFLISAAQATLSTPAYYQDENGTAAFSTVANPTGHIVGSTIAQSDKRFFINGVQSGSTTTNAPATTLPTVGVSVMAYNFAGTAQLWYSGRVSAYSIGRGMTAAQVSAYTAAMLAFRAALNRS